IGARIDGGHSRIRFVAYVEVLVMPVVGDPVDPLRMRCIDFEGELRTQRLCKADGVFRIKGGAMVRVVDVVDPSFDIDAQSFILKGGFGLQVGDAVDGVEPIDGRGGAGDQLHALDIQFGRADGIAYRGADAGRDIVDAVYHL